MISKLSTRQKMINMMYLVLTAMLALNVSSEILRAFFLIETSMAKAGENTDRKIAYSMQVFDSSMRHFPAKTEAFYAKALTARKEMQAFVAYIEELKKELEQESGGRKDDGQLRDADNTDKPSNLLIARGKGAELRIKINELRVKLTSLLDTADQRTFKPAIQAENPSNSLQSWEGNMFDNTPAAASMVILEKIETDAKSTTDDILNKLRAAITKDEITFNNFRAGIIPSSRYVMVGENYNADIFLTAWDSLNEIKVSVNNSNIPVVNGKATYSVSPSKEGEVIFRGSLESKERNGTVMKIPFEQSFFAFKPAATISAKKMNTLYIGVDNPIDISVPGLRPQDIVVSATQGTITGSNGEYKIRVFPGYKETYINVSGRMMNGTKPMGSMKYRVRPLPKPLPSFGTLESAASVAAIRATSKVNATMGDEFAFEGLVYNVTEFSFGYKPVRGDGNIFIVKGPFINNDIREVYRRLKSKDQIIIHDVYASGPTGIVKLKGSLTITVR